MSDEERRPAGVVVRPVVNAIAILRHLADSPGPHTATTVSRALTINPSTCFNILRTLLGEGVIDFDPVTKSYSAGHGLAKLARNLSPDTGLQAARPLLRRIADTYRLTVCLWHRADPERIVAVLVEPVASDFRVHCRVGQRLPLLMGSAGRALGPYIGLDEPALRQAFSALRWARPISFDSYWAEMQEARALGYAIDDGHFASGLVTISAPVLDRSDNAQYAVTGLAFRSEFDADGRKALGEDLAALGRELRDIFF
jgi:DNA-binding IclR family transcriptional regulator